MGIRKEKVVKSARSKNRRRGPKKVNMRKRKTAAVQVDTSEACMDTSISIGTMTEPKYLGPCEPGTSVTLRGFVCCETEGVLVVNVAWRGKAYMGSLLEIRGNDWAPTPPPNRLVADPRPILDTSKLITEEIEHTTAELNCLQTRSSKYNKAASTLLASSTNKHNKHNERSEQHE